MQPHPISVAVDSKKRKQGSKGVYLRKNSQSCVTCIVPFSVGSKRGETTVTVRNLYKIAATLNVSLAEFLAEEGLAFPYLRFFVLTFVRLPNSLGSSSGIRMPRPEAIL
jgi:hypothetical protein